MTKLNHWEKLRNYFEDFDQKYKFKLNYLNLVLTFVIFWLIHQAKLNLNINLPEVINLPNFIGNVDSVLLALLGGFILGYFLTKVTKLNKSKLLKLSILFGTLIGLFQNVLIETRLGMDLLNQQNVSDPLDIMWGTIFCFIACLVSFRVVELKKY
jgi:hypothetical protein